MNPDGETERSVGQYTIPSWRYRMLEYVATCNIDAVICMYLLVAARD